MTDNNIGSEAYFSYSVILPDFTEEDQEVLILGNFIINNTGTETLHNPIICIRVKPVEAAKLGGKIALNRNKNNGNELVINQTSSEEWEYIDNEWKEKIKSSGEHWLRPKHCDEVKPKEMLTFSNFDIRIAKPQSENSVIVEGFVYFKEINKGYPSLNNIIINY